MTIEPMPESSGSELIITDSSNDAGGILLTIKGTLDIRTSPQLKKMLMKCFSEKPGRLDLMLSGVESIDTSGVATLVEGLRWSHRSGGEFVLSGVQEGVLDLIRLSKLESEFEIVDAHQQDDGAAA